MEEAANAAHPVKIGHAFFRECITQRRNLLQPSPFPERLIQLPEGIYHFSYAQAISFASSWPAQCPAV